MRQPKNLLLLIIISVLGANPLCAAEFFSADTIDLDLRVILEGAYNVDDQRMTTALCDVGYLPGQLPKTLFGVATGSGQPFSNSPWGYDGEEGVKDDIEEFYPESTVDWVLVSLRTGISKASEIFKSAALLLDDGAIRMLDKSLTDLQEIEYYVVVEHRNHMIIMSPRPVPVIGNRLSYDFSQSESYISLLGHGQKELADGTYAMFIGNIEHDDLGINDINFSDVKMFLGSNGKHSSYFSADVDFDGDVNVKDQEKILANLGVFTEVPQK